MNQKIDASRIQLGRSETSLAQDYLMHLRHFFKETLISKVVCRDCDCEHSFFLACIVFEE